MHMYRACNLFVCSINTKRNQREKKKQRLDKLSAGLSRATRCVIVRFFVYDDGTHKMWLLNFTDFYVTYFEAIYSRTTIFNLKSI